MGSFRALLYHSSGREGDAWVGYTPAEEEEYAWLDVYLDEGLATGRVVGYIAGTVSVSVCASVCASVCVCASVPRGWWLYRTQVPLNMVFHDDMNYTALTDTFHTFTDSSGLLFGCNFHTQVGGCVFVCVTGHVSLWVGGAHSDLAP